MEDEKKVVNLAEGQLVQVAGGVGPFIPAEPSSPEPSSPEPIPIFNPSIPEQPNNDNYNKCPYCSKRFPKTMRAEFAEHLVTCELGPRPFV